MRVMREHMSDDDLFVSDASLASGWIAGRWVVRVAGRRYYAPRGLVSTGLGPAGRDRGRRGHQGWRHPRRNRKGPPRIVCLAGDAAAGATP